MAQRIVRAKRKLRDNHAPYRIPSAAELPDRLGVVLAAISLIFTEGHTATSGDALGAHRPVRRGDPPRARARRADARRARGRRAARAHAAHRRPPAGPHRRPTDRWCAWPTRTGPGGTVRSSPRDTTWSGRACAATSPGPFQIQAAIAAVHDDAPTADATDWGQIVALYDQLDALRPNAVVELNRAIAIGERDGADAGLAALDALDPEPFGVVPAVPRSPRRPAVPSRTHRRRDRRLRPGDRAHDQPRRGTVPRRAAGSPPVVTSTMQVLGNCSACRDGAA